MIALRKIGGRGKETGCSREATGERLAEKRGGDGDDSPMGMARAMVLEHKWAYGQNAQVRGGIDERR